MLRKTGVPDNEDILKVTPSLERLSKGPVAVIECFQRIPCNPCYTKCPSGAIAKMEDINEIPMIDYEKCNGCGICAMACPGLAIFIVDCSYPGDKAVVKVPYEFLPLPREGVTVIALNREGQVVGDARIIKVVGSKNSNKTSLVWLEVNKDMAMEVRNFRMEGAYAR